MTLCDHKASLVHDVGRIGYHLSVFSSSSLTPRIHRISLRYSWSLLRRESDSSHQVVLNFNFPHMENNMISIPAGEFPEPLMDDDDYHGS